MYIPENVNTRCGIYMIKNTRNGKKYIGSTKNAKVRQQDHFRLLRKNQHGCDHLQHAWNAEEDKSVFQFSMFIYCREDQLISLEQGCFDHMKPEYNSSLIAGRPEHTPAVTAKMSQRKLAFLASPEGIEYLKRSSEITSERQRAFAQTDVGVAMYDHISAKLLEHAASPEGIADYSIRGRKTASTLRERARTPDGQRQMKALGAHNKALCQTEYGKKMAKERAAKGAAKRKKNGSQSGLNHWTVRYKAAHYHGA